MKVISAFTIFTTAIGVTSAEQLLRDTTQQHHDNGVVVANDGAAAVAAPKDNKNRRLAPVSVEWYEDVSIGRVEYVTTYNDRSYEIAVENTDFFEDGSVSFCKLEVTIKTKNEFDLVDQVQFNFFPPEISANDPAFNVDAENYAFGWSEPSGRGKKTGLVFKLNGGEVNPKELKKFGALVSTLKRKQQKMQLLYENRDILDPCPAAKDLYEEGYQAYIPTNVIS